MEHTEYYQLSLWEADDRILREDFNDNHQKIDAALSEHGAALAEKPYVIGSYTGNGKTEAEGGQSITLGFRPRFLIIAGDWADRSTTVTLLYFGFGADPRSDPYVRLTNNGFQVMKAFGSEGVQYHFLNQENYIYSYIAFR